MVSTRGMLSVVMSVAFIPVVYAMDNNTVQKFNSAEIRCGRAVLELFKKTLKPTKEEKDKVFGSADCSTVYRDEAYELAIKQGNYDLLYTKKPLEEKLITLEATQLMKVRAEYHKNWYRNQFNSWGPVVITSLGILGYKNFDKIKEMFSNK